MAAIRTVRNIEQKVRFWEVVPAMHLLDDVEENEAYCAAKEGEYYLVYFPMKGFVNIDLNDFRDDFELNWINVKTSEWGTPNIIPGGGQISLENESSNGAIAVITKKVID